MTKIFFSDKLGDKLTAVKGRFETSVAGGAADKLVAYVGDGANQYYVVWAPSYPNPTVWACPNQRLGEKRPDLTEKVKGFLGRHGLWPVEVAVKTLTARGAIYGSALEAAKADVSAKPAPVKPAPVKPAPVKPQPVKPQPVQEDIEDSSSIPNEEIERLLSLMNEEEEDEEVFYAVFNRNTGESRSITAEEAAEQFGDLVEKPASKPAQSGFDPMEEIKKDFFFA
jgi:hypothetical protein